MSYFEHLGVFGSLASSTFDTFLDDLLTDMGCSPGVTPITPLPSNALAGTGSAWRVYDDLRSDALAVAVPAVNGTVTWIGNNIAAPGDMIGTAPGNVSRIDGASTKFQKEFPLGCYVKHPVSGVYWKVVGYDGTLPDTKIYVDASGGVPAATGASQIIKRKAPAIVLKCTSTQKTFYVQIVNPRDGRWLCVCSVWEYWNNTGGTVTLGGQSATAHTGVNGFVPGVTPAGSSSQGLGGGRIRSYYLGGSNNGSGFNDGWTTNAMALTTAVTYILSLLDDSFILYGGGHPTVGNDVHDCFIAQNLTPFRTNPLDTDTTIAGCTSNRYGTAGADTIWASAQGNSGSNQSGGCSLLRDLSATLWKGGYQIWPKAPTYLFDFNRSVVDRDNSFDVTDAQVIQGSTGAPDSTPEMKRGDVKNIKFPMSFPGGTRYSKFNVNENGTIRQHVMLAAHPPDTSFGPSQSPDEVTQSNSQGTSGSIFEYAGRYGTGSGVAISAALMWRPFWFLIPTT